MNVSKKQILKAGLLPGIFPRVRSLFGSGFGTLAYMIAVVYQMVRILPAGHPYLQKKNTGQYSVRDVIAEAANHIQLTRNNIDQILIFLCVIAGLVIMVIQFILLLLTLFIGQARAQDMPTDIAGFFQTPNPSEDLAYRFMDLVFGLPEMFGSKEDVPYPIHAALHSMLEFYSVGMVIVGAIIILYLAVAVVAETAQSGIPFGQRFNRSWAVPRIIIFFGLLIPVTAHGINGAQYVTFASAKLGSALASTGWVKFNESLISANELLTGRPEQNVAYPGEPDLSFLPGNMMMARACKLAYEDYYNIKSWPKAFGPGDETGILAWAVYKEIGEDGNGSWAAQKMESTSFQNLTEKAKGLSDIHIVFGAKDNTGGNEYKASVIPVCGEYIMRVTDVSEPGVAVIQTTYWDLIEEYWNGEREIDTYAEAYVNNYAFPREDQSIETEPDREYIRGEQEYLSTLMSGNDGQSGKIREAVDEQIVNGNWTMPENMQDYGWAGAGIWYNRIASQNGALVSAIQQVPIHYLYPLVIERVKQNALQQNQNPDIQSAIRGALSSGSVRTIFENQQAEAKIFEMEAEIYEDFFGPNAPIRTQSEGTGNPVIDIMNALLGTEGLFELCRNTAIHPLAQLSMLGKSMLDRSIQSFALSGALSFLSVIPLSSGPALSSISSFFSIFAGIGLLIGFLLFYVLPFLPFIYFFFAVGNWVKGIFEAIVAMPLWALAHLRIDGDGIPGDAAMGGYYLLFEIFIRPILIVIGLLAAVVIFAAMVKVLNQTFYLAISNLSGHDPKSTTVCFTDGAEVLGDAEYVRAELKDAYRGPVDEFFFTIVYTILVYMIGMACFKLIDTIPNELLRWIGAEVSSFSDQAGDSAQGLMKYVALGGSQVIAPIGDSIGKLGGGISKSVSNLTSAKTQ